MISDLTGLDVANASLLDESSACAEAMTLSCRATKRNVVLYDPHLHPQNIAVLQTRAKPIDIKLEPLDVENVNITRDIAGIIIQYPNTEGLIYENIESIVELAHESGALVTMACDPLSLCLLRSPGDLKADIVVGNAQRFGIPLGYGGPHVAFMSVAKTDNRNLLARLMPGRLVGISSNQLCQILWLLTTVMNFLILIFVLLFLGVCTTQLSPIKDADALVEEFYEKAEKIVESTVDLTEKLKFIKESTASFLKLAFPVGALVAASLDIASQLPNALLKQVMDV
ncbi:unnamed protein product [Bursaphelenchus okinawaensis]|uniref:Glycine cleavage system P-protein N-terminal domain-containing protein n=1 Tax=Bursaphelenchus okinawaensis TaxID=465554 RepID=A0A811KBR7_9BILA|nr:unnamed protein product [Bursaphelenchus okinawaensis]CAG9097652.1 unnamed protein product [Bursaphelenchus okinawaensis]